MRRTSFTALVSATTLAFFGLAISPVAAVLPTTLTVNTTSDLNDAPCMSNSTTTPNPLSLRDAVCLANNLPIGTPVVINVPAGTYSLTLGELDLGTTAGVNVTVSGAGAASTVIDAGGHSRVFNIDMNSVGGVTTTLQSLTIQGGNDSSLGGAGILAGSAGASPADALSLSGVTVTGNNNGAQSSTTKALTNIPGGGLQFLGGSLSIINSTFSNNTTQSSPGSAIAYQAWGVGTESFSMTNTTISNNSETNLATASDIEDGAVQLSSPTNQTTGPSGIPMTIVNSTFSGNTSTGANGPTRGSALTLESGGLSVTGSTFSTNTVTGANSKGGAIAVVDGVATIQKNRIVGNVAPTSAQGSGLAAVGAGTVNATDNWWGCNAGPGNTGCDSTYALTPSNLSTAPRLVLSGSAVSLLISATAPVAADLTHDSTGAAVSGSEPALNGVGMAFSSPTPAGSSCSPNSVTMSGGTANGSCTFTPGGSGVGQVSVKVDNQTVNIPVTVNAPPSITTNPSDATVLAGGNTSFTAAASGYPAPTVQWYVSTDGGTSYSSIASATSPTLNLTAVPTSANQNEYRAVFTNIVSSATTNPATLTVHAPPSFTSGATANFTAGTHGSFTISTSGLPANSTISTTSTLPSGLTLSSNGDGTATLSGTPAAGTGGSYTVNLTANNGISPDATQALTVVVSEAPAVTTNPSDVTTTPGATASLTAAASGYPSPTVQWQKSTDGGATFTNIPSATSTTYQVTASIALDGTKYRAVFSNGVGTPGTTTAATLTVHQAPAITSAASTSFTAGSAGTFTVTTTGYPAPVLTETGALPSGVTFVDNHDGTATLAGTPSASGTYPISITASNGVNPDATSNFTLTVTLAPMITSANATTFTVGSAATFSVTTTGVPAPGLTETGTLPSGVTFTDNHNGTGTLAGTPPPGSGGVYHFSFQANNGIGTGAGQDFTLTVNEAPSITSADHTTFTAGAAGTFTVTTTGFPNASISHTGSLPSGVTLVDNNDGTATLSGTPHAGTGGTYQFAIDAGNGVGSGAAQTFTLTVNEAETVTSANTTTFVAGTAGTFTVTTSGFPVGSLTETGALPSGVTFTDKGDGTATLSGTPAAGTDGSYPLTFTAHNGVGTDGAQDFTLKVNEAAAITSAATTAFTVGSSGTFKVKTTGTPTPSISKNAGLPNGLTFVDNGDGTATISGTPAAGTGGRYEFTITAHNGVGTDATQNFVLIVNEAATITSANSVTFGAAVAASPFTVTTGGYPVTSLSESGALPSGVTFTDNGDGTATLAGMPASGTAGSYPITITGHNGIGTDATQDFTLVVTVAPQTITFTSTPPTDAVVGQAYDVAATGGGSGNAVTFTIEASATSVCSVSGSTVTLNHPGNCVIDAHQNGNGQYAPTDNQQSLAVGMASTSTAMTVASHTITATVTAVSPGAGTPSGTVTFSVNGSSVGTASLNASGVATLTYTVPNGQTQNVAAVYAGDSDYTGSSVSTARQDPTITASALSSVPKTKYGWYRKPVRVTFTCTATSAPLTAPCPSPVTLSGNGAGQSVTRTIMATDGGAATAGASGINIDMTPPSVAVTGVTSGATYLGVSPKAKCVAKDALSGVASCTLKSTSRAGVVSVTATAVDEAGNVATAHKRYRVLQIFVLGKTPKNGAYNLQQGHRFTVVALTSSKARPRYYDAVPFGQTPRTADNYFKLAGRQNGMYRYTISVYLNTGMSRYKYWTFGVKVGKNLYQVKFHPTS